MKNIIRFLPAIWHKILVMSFSTDRKIMLVHTHVYLHIKLCCGRPRLKYEAISRNNFNKIVYKQLVSCNCNRCVKWGIFIQSKTNRQKTFIWQIVQKKLLFKFSPCSTLAWKYNPSVLILRGYLFSITDLDN